MFIIIKPATDISQKTHKTGYCKKKNVKHATCVVIDFVAVIVSQDRFFAFQG